MIKLRIPLAGAVCFTLMSCQVGVGTPSECSQRPESCKASGPNQLTGSDINNLVTNTASEVGSSKNINDSNSPTKTQNLLAPDNFQITEQTAQTLRVKWDIKEKTPHSYILYLNGKAVAKGVNLSTYTFTNLKTNEDYELAIEAVNTNGKSSFIKLSSFDDLKEKANPDSGSTGSGSTGSGSTGSGSTGSGSTGSGSTDSGSTDSDATDSGSKCPKGSLISVCVGIGGIGGIGLGI